MGCGSTPKESGNIKKVPTTIENVEIVEQGQKEEKTVYNLNNDNQKSFKKENKNTNFIEIVVEEKKIKEIEEKVEDKRLKELEEEEKRLIEEEKRRKKEEEEKRRKKELEFK